MLRGLTVVEASFLRVNSDMELRQLKKLFDVYPRDMPASQPPEGNRDARRRDYNVNRLRSFLLPERSDEELEEISQYPLVSERIHSHQLSRTLCSTSTYGKHLCGS